MSMVQIQAYGVSEEGTITPRRTNQKKVHTEITVDQILKD